MTLPAKSRLGRYEIERALGSGGMGEVYLALDPRLARHVAVKVLPQGTGGVAGRRERFAREARAVAALSHPHICTLFDVGADEDVPYLVMEYLPGDTLGERLGRGALDPSEAAALGAREADALAAAHAQGIVHRDLKPANIKLTASGPKVLDFGLAKWLDAGPGEAEAETVAAEEVTREGTVLGSASYMSPEQAQGLSVDHRTDLFSLGVILYEACTGQRPFRGANRMAILASVIRDDPPPLRSLAAEAPAALEEVVARCLRKDREARWQSAAELAAALGAVPDDPGFRASAAGVPSAASAPRAADPAAASGPGSGGPPRIAVMPFDNPAGSAELAWLRTGIPGMLETALAQTPGLEIVSGQRVLEALRELSDSSDGFDRSRYHEAARAVAASLVVTGNVFRAKDQTRLDVQVADVSTGKILFGHVAGGDDIFGLVDGLSASIRRDVDVSTSGVAPVADRATRSVEAYRLYHEAVEAQGHSRTPDALAAVRRALEIDPEFASAYYLLARLVTDPSERAKAMAGARDRADRLPEVQRLGIEARDARDRGDLEEEERILQQVVKRFPDETRAWRELIDVQARLFAWERVRETSERAVRACPSSGATRNFAAYAKMIMGAFDEALAELEEYQRLNPTEPNTLDSLAEMRLVSGDPNGAAETYRAITRLDPSFAATQLGLYYTLAHLGHFDAARDVRAASGHDDVRSPKISVIEGLAAARGGRLREADAHLTAAIRLYVARGSPVEEAAVELQRADHALARGRYAEVHRAVGRYEKTAPGILEGPERLLHDLLARLYLVAACVRSGDVASAREIRAEQQELVRGRTAPYRWLESWAVGELALADGDTQAARAAFTWNEVPPLQPFSLGAAVYHLLLHNVTLRDGLARVHRAEGDTAGAIAEYERLLHAHRGARWVSILEPRYRLEIARLHRERGDRAAAARESGRFLELWKDADPGQPETEEARRLAGLDGGADPA